MASAAIADCDVFIALTRRDEDLPRWLGGRFDDIYTCGLVRLEVLRGIKEPRQRDEMAGYFNVLCHVQTDNKLWDQATELGWELDRRGRIPNLRFCFHEAGSRLQRAAGRNSGTPPKCPEKIDAAK